MKEINSIKVCVIQPEYSIDYSRSEELFEKQQLLAQCDETVDWIALPEATDIPALAKTKEQSEKSAEKNNFQIVSQAVKRS